MQRHPLWKTARESDWHREMRWLGLFTSQPRPIGHSNIETTNNIGDSNMPKTKPLIVSGVIYGNTPGNRRVMLCEDTTGPTDPKALIARYDDARPVLVVDAEVYQPSLIRSGELLFGLLSAMCDHANDLLNNTRIQPELDKVYTRGMQRTLHRSTALIKQILRELGDVAPTPCQRCGWLTPFGVSFCDDCEMYLNDRAGYVEPEDADDDQETAVASVSSTYQPFTLTDAEIKFGTPSDSEKSVAEELLSALRRLHEACAEYCVTTFGHTAPESDDLVAELFSANNHANLVMYGIEHSTRETKKAAEVVETEDAHYGTEYRIFAFDWTGEISLFSDNGWGTYEEAEKFAKEGKCSDFFILQCHQQLFDDKPKPKPEKEDESEFLDEEGNMRIYDSEGTCICDISVRDMQCVDGSYGLIEHFNKDKIPNAQDVAHEFERGAMEAFREDPNQMYRNFGCMAIYISLEADD